MPQAIRKHWRLVMANLLLVVLATSALLWRIARPTARADVAVEGGGGAQGTQQPVTIDPVIYAKAQALRETVALSNEDLAAMGCSPQQAGAVLQAVLQWSQANAAEWSTREQAAASARKQTQDVVRSLNVGPLDASALAQLPQLIQQRDAAEQSVEQLTQSAVAAVNAALTYPQQQLWSTIRTNAQVPAPLRYVANLSAQDLKTPAAAYANHASEIQDAAARQASALAAVVSTEQSVLPDPSSTQAPGAPSAPQ